MSYHVDMSLDGLALIVRDRDQVVIGRALTQGDAEKIVDEMSSPGVFRDKILDAVTDAIEEAFG